MPMLAWKYSGIKRNCGSKVIRTIKEPEVDLDREKSSSSGRETTCGMGRFKTYLGCRKLDVFRCKMQKMEKLLLQSFLLKVH